VDRVLNGLFMRSSIRECDNGAAPAPVVIVLVLVIIVVIVIVLV